MSFAPAWDRRARLTLRFADPDLERAYEAETFEPARRRLRWGVFANVPLWVMGGLLVPNVFPGVDPRLVWAGSIVMITLLGGAGIVAGRAATRRQVDVCGFVVNVVAGVIVLGLTVAVGLFDEFGPVLIVFAAMTAFGVHRIPFVAAALCTLSHVTVFTIFAAAVGTGAPFQVFIVASALGIALSGVYIVENSERQVFAQARLIAHLHRRVDELFRQYVSPDIARSLLEDPDRAGLGGEEVEVTVLVADLTGYTSFSERVRPEEAMAMLNRAFSAAVPIVLGEGGTIVQFAGDALIAIFNAPVRRADHALRATRAAHEIQRATLPPASDHARPRFRIGITSGPALVGNVGSAELHAFTAIGDTTNVAARLQTYAPPGSVVVGDRTRELVGEGATFRPLGTPKLKGKSVPVAVYELVEVLATAST